MSQVFKRQAELAAESKTEEEQKPLIGETLKVEGEKLDRMLAAAAVAKKRPDYLKRVVVLQLNEGEKAPQNAVQVGELYYLCEYFPQPETKRPQKRDFKEGPRGKGKGKGRGRRGDRRPRRDGEPGEARSASERPAGERGEGGGADAQKKRRRFRPRRPGGQGKPAGAEAQKPAGGASAAPVSVPTPAPSSTGETAS